MVIRNRYFCLQRMGTIQFVSFDGFSLSDDLVVMTVQKVSLHNVLSNDVTSSNNYRAFFKLS